MEPEKQKNFITRVLQKAKAISKAEKTFKIIKKLKQAVQTISKNQNKPFQEIIQEQANNNLIVYHYGQGLQLDYKILQTTKNCQKAHILLKTGCPYGMISFQNKQLSKQFMRSCLTVQGSYIHYLQIQFNGVQRIVFYFYSKIEKLWNNDQNDIQNCSSFEDYQPIPGLLLYNNFLTSDEQNQLVKQIDSCKWIHLSNRKVQHYGFEFKYGKNNINKHQKIKPIPEFFNPLLDRIIQLKLADYSFDQLTINCYDPGDGIPSHFDTHSPFEQTFVSISLLSDIVMEFRSYRKQMKQVLLKGKSLVAFKDQARFAWTHGIAGRKVDKIDEQFSFRRRRISLTFRKIKFQPCLCRFYFYCDSQGYDQNIMKKTNPLLLKYLASQNIAKVDQNIQRQLVQKVYNRFGHTFNNPIHPKVVDFINNLLPLSFVLDIGCGNGNYLRILQKNNHIAIGIQQCISMKGDQNQQRIYADALTLPFKSQSMDYILMIAVFHHFSTQERRLISLNQIYRVLKPSGRAMITVWSHQKRKQIYPNQDVLIDFTLPKHRSITQEKEEVFKRYYHLFKKDQILELVHKCKFMVLSITEQYDNYYIQLQKK